jgi:hypothetical protein
MSVSGEQLQRANQIAQLSVEANKSIEQAGRGLVLASNQCRASTAGLNTIEILAHVQGHVADAIRAVTIRETLSAVAPAKIIA